jgi:N-acetyl-anhydromuramyl-L-alanine amidase AmpD
MAMTIDTSHTSPNQSSRNGADISMLVIHATVGSYAASLAWLCNPASRASTHYLIRKDGYISQLVPDSESAWHAGVSKWFNLGSTAIREQSIGIELENANNGVDPYPQAQLDALTALSKALVQKYAIVPDMVTRHLDIAQPHGRKTDPAGFPWLPFKAALYAQPAQPSAYRVLGTPVWQRQDCTGPIAMYLGVGVVEQVDKHYPDGTAHLASGAGFIKIDVSVEAV